MAIGKLYKQREIVITGNGICLPDHPDAKELKSNPAKPAQDKRKKNAEKGKKRSLTNNKSAEPKAKKKVYRNPKLKSEKTLSLKKGS